MQALAREGYAVLQMNYRGSGGYGKKWREASYKDWGGLPYSDTIDGLKWAVEQKNADPARVCVVGGSFGGYLALSAAARDSAMLKCVVSVAGRQRPARAQERFELLLEFPGREGHDRQRPGEAEGGFAAAARRQRGVPVLLVHGVEDYTVEPDQSEFMAKALAAANKPYKMVMMEDTDHYFTTQAQQRQLFTDITDFVRPLLLPAT